MQAGLTRFPRQARLTEPGEYQRVFKQCRCKAGDRWMTMLAIPNDTGYPRLGLAISRKAARTAVARNRIKRRIRETFRHRQTELGGLDIVVIARPGIALQSNPALNAALQTLWKRLITTCAGS
ncbi:MAG: ribonuclease P protein component [Pseudomonadota bacterium]